MLGGSAPAPRPAAAAHPASSQDQYGTCSSTVGARAGQSAVPATGRIAGRVLDEQLKPVRGATVSAQRVRSSGADLEVRPDDKGQRTNPGYTWGPAAVTNPSGEYQLDNLRAGQYYVSVVVDVPPGNAAVGVRPRAAKFGYGNTFYPGSTQLAYASPVRLSPGAEVTGIDIRLEKSRLARITGRVTATRNLSDGQTSVVLTPSAAFGAGRLAGFSGFSSVSADGTFAIADVPPGDYVLTARSLPSAVLRDLLRTGSSAPLTRDLNAEFGTLPITVDGRDIGDVQLALSSGGRIAGRVTLDGRPFDPGAKYVAVVAAPADTSAIAAGATSVRVGRDGRFDIRGVAGKFVIRMDDPGKEFALARVAQFGRDVTDSGVLISPLEQSVDIEIALTSLPTELTGRVLLPASSEPQASPCVVVVFSTDDHRWSLPESRYVATAAPSSGVFSVVGLPPGKYWAVAVSNVDEPGDVSYLAEVRRLATEVSLREGETASVTLRLQR
jgi:hypothetical protein